MPSHPVPYERLIAYAADELDEPEAAAVASHLATCAECAATLARFRTVRAVLRSDDSEAPPAATLVRARGLFAQRRPAPEANWLQRVLARLTFDSRAGPALVGARGIGRGYQLAFESDVADVDLELEPGEEPAGDRWRLLGQVAVHEDAPVAAVRLASPGTTTPVVQTTADEHGLFTLQAPLGRYDLLVSLPRVLLVLPDIEIG